jgi:hypothetical protein
MPASRAVSSPFSSGFGLRLRGLSAPLGLVRAVVKGGRLSCAGCQDARPAARCLSAAGQYGLAVARRLPIHTLKAPTRPPAMVLVSTSDERRTKVQIVTQSVKPLRRPVMSSKGPPYARQRFWQDRSQTSPPNRQLLSTAAPTQVSKRPPHCAAQVRQHASETRTVDDKLMQFAE